MPTRKSNKRPTPDGISRLDDAITRLAAATTELTAGVAAHSQRLNQMEQQTRETKQDLITCQVRHDTLMGNTSASHEKDYRTLNDRIGSVQTDLTEKLNVQTQTVTAKLDEVKDVLIQKIEEGDHKLAVRVKRLESWRTFIAGGSFIIVAIFVYVLVKLLTAFVPSLNFLK